MAISKLQGSLQSTSTPTTTDKVNDTISTAPSPEQQQVDKNYNKDTFINKNALNIDRHTGILRSLEKFLSGSDISVTYYHHQYSATSDQSHDGDITDNLDPVHNSILRINNFELKLQDPLAYTYDNGEITSELVGEAICYSGFNPMAGDWFLYEVEAGLLGRFVIDNPPTRLSIQSNTCNHISFRLDSFPSSEDLAAYELSVRDVRWFDKQSFLIGEGALLETESYIFLKDAAIYIEELSNYFYDSFYDTHTYDTYVRPDGIYDPYIVDFLNEIVGCHKSSIAPVQLYPNPPGHRWTIWNKIKDGNRVPFSKINTKWSTMIKRYGGSDVGITALLNRSYVHLLEDPVSENIEYFPYIFDEMIGVDSDSYNIYQTLLVSFLNSRAIHLPTLRNCYDNYLELSDIEQFYNIPIMIFMFKEAIASITETYKHNTDAISTLLPIGQDLTIAQMSASVLVLESTSDFKVIGLSNPMGKVVYINKYKHISSTDTTIDIGELVTDLEIDVSLLGWKLYTNKSATVTVQS